ncbi:hypothetical protein [Sphaerisporangium aureirubrum]|uniref:Uncharacterized protein n=1 Tax=Sphaerisporangium aureirubrum TaxID=1544736 RepID=A0ABW1NRV4_9ACTN
MSGSWKASASVSAFSCRSWPGTAPVVLLHRGWTYWVFRERLTNVPQDKAVGP